MLGIGGFCANAVAGGNGPPRLANILLNLKVEPGPRWVGGFNRDFLPFSGDVISAVPAPAAVVEVVVVVVLVDFSAAATAASFAARAACCEGGKGMLDCLLLADEGVVALLPCVNTTDDEEISRVGGVVGF